MTRYKLINGERFAFTAEDARTITAIEGFTSRGRVIDAIKKAARNGQEQTTIPGLNLTLQDEQQFTDDGFIFNEDNISWSEN